MPWPVSVTVTTTRWPAGAQLVVVQVDGYAPPARSVPAGVVEQVGQDLRHAGRISLHGERGLSGAGDGQLWRQHDGPVGFGVNDGRDVGVLDV